MTPKNAVAQPSAVEGAVSGAAELDVDRLARALELTEVGCWANPVTHSAAQDEERHRRDATRIAAEYARLSENAP